ncbi:MAG: restriction endonuclease, partial [Candidatus Dadabacteria bacterium]|nr:restriction endonuclease [Candidatus Dadabacteria bacterium]
ALSSNYGHDFCEYVKWQYAPTGLSDLVVYFLRRIYGLLRDNGFAAIITTNSIVDGNIRKDGLQQIVTAGGEINMAVRGMKWPGVANLVVSLLALHKGKWDGLKELDNQPVKLINTFFEAGENIREPVRLAENSGTMYQGSISRGDGFLLTHDQADALILRDQKNKEVIKPIINGKEVNSEPNQVPGRSTIDFFNMSEVQAGKYQEPFSIVSSLVKPVRMALNDKTAINQDHRSRWWQYAFVRESLYRNINDLSRCFVTARTTKHLSFSGMPTDIVFSDALYVFTTDRWDLFALVQSTLHEVWARKYSGSLKQDLRYSPSKCFDTFAFPTGLWQNADIALADLGKRYHTHRKQIMCSLWVGLTKIYNLFHACDLSTEIVAKVSKKGRATAAAGFEAIIELRRLHIALDIAVRDAYGWQDLNLEHDFHKVETLPENDRVRYTISPAARREVLKRLLAENHVRTGSETNNPISKSKRSNPKRRAITYGPDLFRLES